jgi:hypothetical protein
MNQSAESAINRYLADLKQVLSAAPKAARADALRDAAEFLSNEISSPDAMHLEASEQQAYDHFIESYGSPSQVATAYLQSQATTPRTECLPDAWKYLAVALTIVLVAAGAYYFGTYETPPDFYKRYQTPPKVSPFTKVDFQGDKILVEFNSTTYEWLGIDGIPVSKVSASSKKQFRDLWQKRITEDLVEVLWGMGHYPGKTVKLQLLDTRENAETTIAAAPMTRANRQAMYGNYIVSVVSPKDEHE